MLSVQFIIHTEFMARSQHNARTCSLDVYILQ